MPKSPPLGTRVKALKNLTGVYGGPTEVPVGTHGTVETTQVNDPRLSSVDFKVRYDNGVLKTHSMSHQGSSWELADEAGRAPKTPPPIGSTVRALKNLGGARRDVKPGTEGTVVNLLSQGRIKVDYGYCDDANFFTHDGFNEGISWERVGSDTLTIQVQEQRSTDLFSSTSTEVINGVVPQVKYGDEIVWQGDPVSTTDNDGNDLSKDQQHRNALNAAQVKTKEVVKGLFT